MSEEKVKKSKRKRREEETETILSDKPHIDETKEKKRAKRAEKKALMEQLPKTDDNGIAYTKLQLRRMMKRVKRGLPPILTEEEQEELRRQEAQTRREEEAELAGLVDSLVDKEDETNEDGSGQHDGDSNDDGQDEDEHNTDQATSSPAAETTSPSRKRKQRSKPVPEDYVCQACKNEHQPAHWIYDCPNKVSKKLRGIHAPDERKVFVSGLAFDMKKRDIELLFQDCGSIVHCKLLTFPDTGRCKGQAYLTFDCEANAKKAMNLSGTILSNDDDHEHSKETKKGEESSNKRKDLKLKVTKVLTRAQTKFNKSTTA